MFKGKISLILFLFAFVSVASAQKHTNAWYFGKRVSLNFNTQPPQVLNDGVISSYEGTSSIADNNGQLLFYTNGNVVVNKAHTIMQNGSQLLGNLSSTCNAVIVPVPGDDKMYYLFTVGAAGYGEGFRYSVIDMRLDNGLGAVVSKNNLIEDDAYEKLAAVRHCNKKDVWITIRKWDSDEYHSYLLTATGLSPSPVISHTGLVVGGFENNSLGYLKFSADGSKLAAAHSVQLDIVEVLNFNNVTGELTNSISFPANAIYPSQSHLGTYGIEFSPNNRFLYVSANVNDTMKSILYQFDVSSMDPTTILSSKHIMVATKDYQAGALQVASDGKIYYSMFEDKYLSVINSPDLPGTASNFGYRSFLINNQNPGPLQYGLPTFIAGDMDEKHSPYDFSFRNQCGTLLVQFTLNKTISIDSVRWNFGDGQFSTEFNPAHTYNAEGVYAVTVTLYKTDCSGTFQNLTYQVPAGRPVQMFSFLPSDTALCSIKDFTITSTYNSPTYLN